MSFNLTTSFVSREILDEDGNSKQIEWDKVRSEAEKAISQLKADPSSHFHRTNSNVPSEPYDPRTLYERLQEQKTMKEDAIKEAMRFSNLVKRVDDEEMEYYRSLTDTQLQAELEKKRQEMKELEEYRKAVEQASPPPPVSLITKENGTAINEAIPASKVQNKRNKSTKDLLQGVVVAKNAKSLVSYGDDSSSDEE
ncbi:unnamed protein product [Umbelopsis vinacea]